MRTFFRRLLPWQWALLIGMYVGLALHTSWNDGKLTPTIVLLDVLLGVTLAFFLAWGLPWAWKLDAKIKRLFSRR